jgi:NitT/TauT family transport system permease protein
VTATLTKPAVRPAAKTAKAAAGERSWLRFAGPFAVLAILIAGWYGVTYLLLDASRRFLMPAPHDVVLKGFLGKNFPNMLEGLARTTGVALTGLAIAFVVGVAWAVLMSQASWAETSLFPYAVVLQCIPILALVPLIGFWFGFGFQARVLVCVLIALFPIVSNTLFGLKSVDRGHRELFALHKTRRLTRLVKLELPAALPALFEGLRVSAGLAVVGAIVGDFFFKQGAPGIGILIDNYRSRLQSPELFAAILLASALGVLVFAFFGWLGNKVVGSWHNPKR